MTAAFSGPYRADPSQVPFFPPVAAGRLELGGHGSGVGTVIGGGAGILGSHAEGYPWFAAGVAMLGFVVWVMVRRYRIGKL